MNEDQLIEFLNNIDDDLVEQEVDKLLEGVKIDMDSIHKKAYKKLNKENKNIKRRRFLPYVSVACIGLLSISTIYASDISEVIKSFFNKTPVYSTIVDGDAYYLKEKYPLSDDIILESVMVSKGNLEVEVISKSTLEELKDISIVPKNNNVLYTVGGYSEDENNKYFFSFYNEKEQNYNITPFQDFTFTIGGNSYDISLESAKKLDLNGEVYAAQNNIEGVNIGAQKIEENDKLNIQLIASFENSNLELVTFGEAAKKKWVSKFENKGEEGMFASSTSSKTNPIYVIDKEGKEYELTIPKDAKGRPITIFETEATQDQELTLKLPAVIATDNKQADSFALQIPKEGEITLNKEIDFNVQKAVIKNIKRLSPTSAQLEVSLNTKEDNTIFIKSFNFYSEDFKKTSCEFEGDKASITIEFKDSVETTNVEIGDACFEIQGNWSIDIK